MFHVFENEGSRSREVNPVGTVGCKRLHTSQQIALSGKIVEHRIFHPLII